MEVHGSPLSKDLHIHEDPNYFDITNANAEDYEWERRKEVMENIVKLMKVKKPVIDENASSGMSVKRAAKRTISETKSHWLDALQKAKTAEDPWKEFNIENEKPERAIRFRYNALKKKWVQDNIEIKMQNESFAHGAMRECFRMKKLSKIVHQQDWSHATNIVAKRYIEEVLPKVYIDDVKLQMDAKLWAEEFNRHDPPKKVDIVQVGCIKLIDRKDTPMYHIEHFVEGDYVKYNSNSGFVLSQDKTVRATPQAFSHFSFERSGHQMMVVDVQGVGDLYTDPQIHTASGDDYGEANLGTKGMALFFASHRCLNICRELNLQPFDLSEVECQRANGEVADNNPSNSSTEIKPRTSSESSQFEPNISLVQRIRSIDSGCSDCQADSPVDIVVDDLSYEVPRRRLYSELDSGISSEEEGVSHFEYFNKQERKCSSVNVGSSHISDDTIKRRLETLSQFKEEQATILGQLHYDLALYNYVGRFTDTTPDHVSAIFHLEKAAADGNLQAMKLLAFKYFSFDTDEFAELELNEDHDKGINYLLSAASLGDTECLIKAAQAFQTGKNLGANRTKSYKEALKWFEAALTNIENNSAFDSFPAHQIQATMAEIWREGGFDIEKDPSYAGELYTSAAESAMAIGKGKLSNKYFMLAEEAWGEVEEE